MPYPANIPTMRPGEPITAEKLNRIIRELTIAKNQAVPTGSPSLVTSFGRGFGGSGGAGGGAALGLIGTRFEILDTRYDYLVCKRADDTNDPPAKYLVAKPWDLRKSPFHEQTINDFTYEYTGSGEIVGDDAQERTSDDGATVETQKVTPPYFTGALILAARGVSNGLGLTVTDVVEIPAEDGTGATTAEVEKQVEWIDLNTAGRAWAVEA
jgi:hypothetical protein